MDNAAPEGHLRGVPNLSKWTPGMGSKSLSVREHRSNAVMHTQRITLPARMVIDARDEARRLHDRIVAEIPAGDPAAVASLVKAAVALRGQLLDLLSLPTRPRGESRRRRPIDAPGIPTDALEIAPPAPSGAPAPDANPVTH